MRESGWQRQSNYRSYRIITNVKSFILQAPEWVLCHFVNLSLRQIYRTNFIDLLSLYLTAKGSFTRLISDADFALA
jgi:hypothetical protein